MAEGGRDPWFWQGVRLRAQTLENVLEPREVVKLASGVLKSRAADEPFVDMCARRFVHYVKHGGASISETVALWSSLLKLGVHCKSQLFEEGYTFAVTQFSQLSHRDALVLLSCLLRCKYNECVLSREITAKLSATHFCKKLSPGEVSMLLSCIQGLKLPMPVSMLEGVAQALRNALTTNFVKYESQLDVRTISVVLNVLAFNKVGWSDRQLAQLLADRLVQLPVTSPKRVLRLVTACERLQLFDKPMVVRLSTDLQAVSDKITLQQLIQASTVLSNCDGWRKGILHSCTKMALGAVNRTNLSRKSCFFLSFKVVMFLFLLKKIRHQIFFRVEIWKSCQRILTPID